MGRRNVPKAAMQRLAAFARRGPSPALGSIDLGDLARTTPASSVFGFDRGTPIDRYYIEGFLESNAACIRGRVLEVGDRTYTERFGGDAVERSDVLHLTGESDETTIVADLTHAPQIAEASFDCVVLTQTLHFTYAMESVVSEVHRVLRPGGCVLCTVPGISQISRYDMDRWGDYWRLTDLSARELFETAFAADRVEVRTYGNVFAAVAFLHGLALEEVDTDDLDVLDRDYQLIVAVKATKADA